MSYTKRNIDELQERGIDPFADAEYDAEYMEFLRDQERDRMAEEWFEKHPNEVVVLRKSDDVMPVSVEVKSTEKVN